MRSTFRQTRKRAGFSLIEVIAAVVIFGIGMLAVAGLYAPVTRAVGGVADAENGARNRPELRNHEERNSGISNPWNPCDILPCRDGKARRVEAGTFPLADGIPGRMGLLRGYGNSICPQLAEVFVRAWMECSDERIMGGGR
jgi:prepilin-type N-terminal cleavage/methylation domain-containing protein